MYVHIMYIKLYVIEQLVLRYTVVSSHEYVILLTFWF
jgi:hypothetical protein